jgi:Protein of unknown function (DUF4238)
MPDQLQHYVPRFLLRRFGQGKKERVWVLDKHTGKQFSFSASKKSTIAVAAEYGMYDFEFMGESVTVEPGLANLESKAAKFIERVILEETLSQTDPLERATLANFLAVQMVRTRAIMTTNQEMFARMPAWLRQEGAPEEFFAPDPKVGDGENAQKALQARLICNAATDYAPALLEKDWVLLKTNQQVPFIMGDHPFTVFNEVDRGLRGNLGLSVEGIQIYFPLSPTLALALWCPSIQQQLLEGFVRLDHIAHTAPHQAGRYVETWKKGIEIVEAIRNGTPLMTQPESVMHFNSLQIGMAERFLFSCDGDFTLAEDMIRENPAFRYGRRMQEMTGKF